MSFAGFFLIIIFSSFDDNKSTSDKSSIASIENTALADDEIIFPHLRIKVDTIAKYYKRRGIFKHFRKLVFQFQLETVKDAPDIMRLICYALKGRRDIMHKVPIPVETLKPISGDTSVPKSVSGFLNLGNLELTKKVLKILIGKPNKLDASTYLNFLPRDGETPYYIRYEILVSNKTLKERVFMNPCPPGSQD